MMKYEPDFDSVGGVADFLSRKGKVETKGSTQAVSMRLPIWTYVQLKKIADANEMSLTEVVTLLLDAALAEAKPKLLESGIDLDAEVMATDGRLFRMINEGEGNS